MSDTCESDSYEVVLYETKDKTKKFIQGWYKGYNEPLYFCRNKVTHKLFWYSWTEDTHNYFGYNLKNFKQEMDIAIRKDTEKFPDLDKIAAYNKENGITPYNDSN